MLVTGVCHASLDHDRLQTAKALVKVLDPGAAAGLMQLEGEQAEARITKFWGQRSPRFGRLYYGYLSGDRYLNVSQAFYNDTRIMPRDFWILEATIDSEGVAEGAKVAEKLTTINEKDAVAWIALAYLQLDLGRDEDAETSLMKALSLDRSNPVAHNGLGLAKLRRPGRWRARDHFRDAFALDHSYEAASFNLAISHLAMKSRDLDYRFRKVIRDFPNHPDAYFKLGVWHDRRSQMEGDYLREAGDSFSVQLEVNPNHNGARAKLARIELETGKVRRAIARCRRLLDEAPHYRPQALSTLMEGYQKLGEIALADSIGSLYVQQLDAPTRALFKDVRPIASEDELQVYDSLNREEHPAFVQAYWQRHDPTPASPGNAKRVEHYRRVGHVLSHFSENADPWDKRGDVYLRYGRPAHRSRSDNIRFETDPLVVRVKERLFGALTEEEKREIHELRRRMRNSTRDVQYEYSDDGSAARAVVSDFEGAEFEADPTLNARMGRLPQPELHNRFDRSNYTAPTDRTGIHSLRGVPLYPIETGRPWEYWIYPDVMEGIEVVFSAMYVGSPYEFPRPPGAGRTLSQHNKNAWVQKQPEFTISRAIKRQPTMLRLFQRSMTFVYDTASFRAGSDSTRVEVYVGVPLDVASMDGVEASVVLYDKEWRELGTRTIPAVADSGDTLGVAEVDFQLPAHGEYILALQATDQRSQATASVKIPLSVQYYARDSLSVSDLEFASHVDLGAEALTKDGMRVASRPGRTYGFGEAVWVYYEIYGLTRDAFGQTRYEVAYTIETVDEGSTAGKALRAAGRTLAGAGRDAAAISYERTGQSMTEHETLAIDLTGREAGRYRLRLRVTDVNSGASIERPQTFAVR